MNFNCRDRNFPDNRDIPPNCDKNGILLGQTKLVASIYSRSGFFSAFSIHK